MIDLEPRVVCLYCSTQQDPNAFNCTQCGGPLPIRQLLDDLLEDKLYDPIASAEAITALMFRQNPEPAPAGYIPRVLRQVVWLPLGQGSYPWEFPKAGLLAFVGISSEHKNPFFRFRVLIDGSQILIDTPTLRTPIGFQAMWDVDKLWSVRAEFWRPSELKNLDELKLELNLIYWQKEWGR